MLPIKRSHAATVVPAASLPGMVLVNFHAPLPEITTPGGNPGKLSSTGCAVEELPAFLKGLEAQHGFTVMLTNPLTGSTPVTLLAGPQKSVAL
jgi:hypothetical protein